MIDHDPVLLGYLRADFGEAAEERLAGVLEKSTDLLQEWGVRPTGWLPGATCSLIVVGERTEEEVVLKAPFLPWELEASLRTMQAFSDHGGVPVLAADELSGTVLLPRLFPGTTLADSGLGEEAELEIWCRLVLSLRKARGDAPPVTSYLNYHEGREVFGPLRMDLADKVRRLLAWLVETSPEPQLLHGDLHHYNILLHGDDWVAIDPEGMLGDPAYEAAAFLRNPIDRLVGIEDLVGLTRQRIYSISKILGDPAERIWGWAMARNLMSVPHNDPEGKHPWTRGAEALHRLGPEFAPALIDESSWKE
ncbi:hypothetical protein EON81_12580 [bacterium]|nr:MAG: hypothetical protein EON81_12580 [bacterium]